MPFYSYKAFTTDGKETRGIVESPSEDQAVRLLKEKQLVVASLTQTGDSPFAGVLARLQRVGFSDIVNFTRQLSTMITAGLSLPQALSILREQTTNPEFAKVLLDIEHQIVGGGNLADALSKYPTHFSSIYVSLIRAGESSGLLDKVLTRLAETMESQREFNSKVQGAMIYPVIIIVGMIIVSGVMMVVVVPKLTELYKDFGISLPMTTQILITVSNFVIRFWWLLIFGAIGGGILFRKWKKTPVGERIVDTYVLKVPIFGNLQKKIILVEFTRTLSMLLSAGIHILDALKTLKNSLGNVLYRDAIEDIGKKVEKGFTLGDTFKSHKEFPPIVSQMMKVGEETGKMDDTLLKLSVYFQSETENLVKGLTTAIEPIIMVFLGVGVGFIVISVITPIYNLTAQFK
jgi:type IV pilus assembly protein PilC